MMRFLPICLHFKTNIPLLLVFQWRQEISSKIPMISQKINSFTEVMTQD